MKLDKGLFHPIHPHHKLKVDYTETPFICDGCKEAGIGLMYKCCDCEFDLHNLCALAVPTTTHPFYKNCDFRFYVKPPGDVVRVCDACGKDVLGFVYHCKGCGFDLHPCCANLPYKLSDGDRGLYLSTKLSSPCEKCGGKGLGWSYRSECKSYNLHVSCVKDLLVEKWHAMSLNVDSNQMREIHNKIPSLRRTVEEQHNKRKVGKTHKYCQIVGGAVKIIVSAVLGDPTAIIAGVVQGIVAK